MKYPLKLIEWEDAYNGDHEWCRVDNLKPTEPHLIQTVGFEVQRTDERVTLSMSISCNGNGCDLFTIPTKMIRREKTLSARLRDRLGDKL